MFNRIRFLTTIAVLALAAALLVAPITVSADQRSIDLQADIGKTFDAVEKNRSEFEAAAKPSRGRLESLAKQAEAIQHRIDSIPGGLPSAERAQQERELNAEAIENAAAFLKEASGLVNHASRLISENMKALNALERRLSDARLGAPDIQALKNRIAEQTAVGRRIVDEIRELAKRAEKDPAQRRRIKSLINSAAAIDRAVTVQKKRLEADLRDGVGEGAGRISGMLQAAISDLGDMYTALEAEKATIGDLHEEVQIALQLSTVESTREVIGRSLPGLGASNDEGIVPGVDRMIGNLRSLNRRSLDQGFKADAGGVRNADSGRLPEIPSFKNF